MRDSGNRGVILRYVMTSPEGAETALCPPITPFFQSLSQSTPPCHWPQWDPARTHTPRITLPGYREEALARQLYFSSVDTHYCLPRGWDLCPKGLVGSGQVHARCCQVGLIPYKSVRMCSHKF